MDQPKQPEDLLHRVFVPIERRNLDGTWSLTTLDKTRYRRGPDGALWRVDKKVNGKQARRERQRARQLSRAR